MDRPYIIPPTRYPKVPWLWCSDLKEGSDPLWGPYGNEANIASAWRIDLYEKDLFPGIDQLALVVHAVRGNGNDGGVIALAIKTTGEADTPKKMDMALLSGPRRHTEEDGA
jgi:hypothetical protein